MILIRDLRRIQEHKGALCAGFLVRLIASSAIGDKQRREREMKLKASTECAIYRAFDAYKKAQEGLPENLKGFHRNIDEYITMVMADAYTRYNGLVEVDEKKIKAFIEFIRECACWD